MLIPHIILSTDRKEIGWFFSLDGKYRDGRHEDAELDWGLAWKDSDEMKIKICSVCKLFGLLLVVTGCNSSVLPESEEAGCVGKDGRCAAEAGTLSDTKPRADAAPWC